MVGSDDGVAFPVTFFDGEREINLGCVKIHPSLEFKRFQLLVGQMIGLSPNQISIYLVDNRKVKWLPESRSKIPITGKADFSAISLKKDCSILAVLKRSRRQRRRKPKLSDVEFSDFVPADRFTPPPEKFLLLRRRQQPELNNSQISGYVLPLFDQLTRSDFVDFGAQTERYLMNLNSSDYDFDSLPWNGDRYVVSSDRTLCEECMCTQDKGELPSFHPCVYDAVTVGFRSAAGPIARPSKAYQSIGF